MTERARFVTTPQNIGSHQLPEFLNPFSYMSSDEARVTLELYNRNVPFSYRYFDGNAPTVKRLMPDFAPEFTLSDYKLVIMVQGGFWGTLTGVLDQTALAQVLLEHDGWKVIILTEFDILHNLTATLDAQFPESVHPTITGGEKPSPFAPPHWMFTRRQFLRGLALLKTNFNPQKVETYVSRKRKRRIAGTVSDGSRRRFGRSSGREVVE
jgi:hypothetical protein